jgi:hypothetical protein
VRPCCAAAVVAVRSIAPINKYGLFMTVVFEIGCKSTAISPPAQYLKTMILLENTYF